MGIPRIHPWEDVKSLFTERNGTLLSADWLDFYAAAAEAHAVEVVYETENDNDEDAHEVLNPTYLLQSGVHPDLVNALEDLIGYLDDDRVSRWHRDTWHKRCTLPFLATVLRAQARRQRTEAEQVRRDLAAQYGACGVPVPTRARTPIQP